MTQHDERQARKEYVRKRQRLVFTVSGAALAVILVVALMFFYHAFGLGLKESPVVQPNYGNTAPCAVDGEDGAAATYVANGQVNVRVLNGTDHLGLGSAVGEALANRNFTIQVIDNYSSTSVTRTTIYFGKNAINEAYTLAANFTDATMVMTAREDKLIDLVIGATFSDLQDMDEVPQAGAEITSIEGCVAADSMTDLPADTEHTAV
ncbi:LytR cell envelope-related transcriptional attenuator [Bifidobacterium lemurum]|uniref:LytR cell envelope-related transcriptional attenuator n=1 Tax=Bifidobacterium lemurum TaxID=1603886 RepID=A0A261FKR8_9BIFI|nr:LytR C-terminal domain-containing protein [Bifidobacterium lemurum]OZG59751.1 LytR cell envelope-related transcriptional attenuator [Bifidobacterium lemurum]QOL35043.1 LytR C-terminal domain-containing protein [Bifidobacterium lemurum]